MFNYNFGLTNNFQKLFCLAILLFCFAVGGCSKDKGTNPDEYSGITTNRYLIVTVEGDLYKVDVLSKSSIRLTFDPEEIGDYDAQFSADGQEIIWQRKGRIAGSNYEVWIMDVSGENKEKIADGVISPIGACSINDEIVLIDATNMLRIYNFSGVYISYLAADGGHKYIPQWSPDGNKVAYITKGDDFGEPTPEENPNIIIFNRDGSGRQDLTNTTETEIFFRWIDNENIAIVRNNKALFIKNVNTGVETQLDDLIARPFGYIFSAPIYLDCSPDGSTVFYVDNDNHLYSVLIADGTKNDISTGTPRTVNESSVSSEGLKIAYADLYYVYVSNLDGSNKEVLYTNYNIYIEDFY